MSAKIYCIECREKGEKYIGSTNHKYLSHRIGDHISGMSKYSSKQIIERGNNWKYYIIEEVDESQKLIREQYWIDNTDNCINKNRAFTGLSEKQYNKEYYELNKDKLKEHMK